MSENTPTTTVDDLANIPVPAGATLVEQWPTNNQFDAQYWRGTQRFVGRSNDPYEKNLTVLIWGTQERDGVVNRRADVNDESDQLLSFSDVAHVRSLAEALIAAVDEWDLMASRDPGTVTR